MSSNPLFNRHLTVFFLFLIASIFMEGCNNNKTPTKEKKQVTTSSSTNALNTFWENYNFNDSTTIKDPAQSEQQFVDFIASFSKYPIDDVSFAIKKMLQKAEINLTVFNFFAEKYALYLYNPNSPMRNDLFYQPVLEYLTISPASTDSEKIRYKMQLDMVSKNQPGNTITDFEYLASDGKRKKLHENKKMAKLLIFYDPECPHCKEILSQLKSSELLNALIQEQQIQVVAIDPMEDKKLWADYQIHIPNNWINGFDHKDILIKKALYNILAYPTLYLIDDKNKVILKDPDYQYLLNFLNQQIQ